MKHPRTKFQSWIKMSAENERKTKMKITKLVHLKYQKVLNHLVWAERAKENKRGPRSSRNNNHGSASEQGEEIRNARKGKRRKSWKIIFYDR
eukprot:UN03656